MKLQGIFLESFREKKYFKGNDQMKKFYSIFQKKKDARLTKALPLPV